DAHTEAPTAGSVILAGVLLKLGTYGFLRFGLYLFPKVAHDLAPLLLTLGVIGIVYGAIVAAVQRDLKRLIAYSSVAHLGFIILRWRAVVAATRVILAAVYLLWAYQRVFHGVPEGDNLKFPELRWREGAVLAPVIALIVFLGVYPKPVLDRMAPSVKSLVQRVEQRTGTHPPASAEGRKP